MWYNPGLLHHSFGETNQSGKFSVFLPLIVFERTKFHICSSFLRVSSPHANIDWFIGFFLFEIYRKLWSSQALIPLPPLFASMWAGGCSRRCGKPSKHLHFSGIYLLRLIGLVSLSPQTQGMFCGHATRSNTRARTQDDAATPNYTLALVLRYVANLARACTGEHA